MIVYWGTVLLWLWLEVSYCIPIDTMPSPATLSAPYQKKRALSEPPAMCKRFTCSEVRNLYYCYANLQHWRAPNLVINYAYTKHWSPFWAFQPTNKMQPWSIYHQTPLQKRGKFLFQRFFRSISSSYALCKSLKVPSSIPAVGGCSHFDFSGRSNFGYAKQFPKIRLPVPSKWTSFSYLPTQVNDFEGVFLSETSGLNSLSSFVTRAH